MAKTQEELNAIKEDVETLNNKLTELTEEELAQVTGGGAHAFIEELLEIEDPDDLESFIK